MQLETLTYLVELNRAGSFNRAAKQLYISPQGLNKAITSLEVELGCAIVERSCLGTKLTPTGSIFAEHAQTIVDEYQHAIEDIQTLKKNGGPILVYTSTYCANIIEETPSLRTFLKYTNVREVSFKELWKQAESSINGREIYFAELYPYTIQKLKKHPSLGFEPLCYSVVGVAWRDGFSLAQKRMLSCADLTNIPIARNASNDIRNYLDDLFSENPLQNVQYQSSNRRLLLEFAHQNCATIIDLLVLKMSRHNPQLNTTGLHFTPLDTQKAQINVGFLINKNLAPSEDEISVRNELSQAIAQYLV